MVFLVGLLHLFSDIISGGAIHVVSQVPVRGTEIFPDLLD